MAFRGTRELHGKYKFLVETRGTLGFAAFMRCSELSHEHAKIEYHEGGALIPIKYPGLMTMSDVTLERGASSDADFFNWSRRVADASKGPGGYGDPPPNFKEEVAIIQLERDGSDLREWGLVGAWPTKFIAGDWDNSANEVVIEQLTLTFDYFELTTR